MESKVIENKWQKIWEEGGYFHAQNNSDKEKYYILVEFPYPSGSGLHVGHVRSYTAWVGMLLGLRLNNTQLKIIFILPKPWKKILRLLKVKLNL